MTDNLENKIQINSDREIYSFDEVFKSSKDYFNGDEMAARIWAKKYALKDSPKSKDENDLTNILFYEKNPTDMHHRIADELYRIENKYPNPTGKEEIFSLIDHFNYIIPQGSPMSGIGNNYQIVSLSNCFVIGNDADSYGGIMKIDEQQVQLMKRRGGVGHDMSHIRPEGNTVLNSALTSTGIVPFMERYSNSTREVAQDGRRGALMLSLSVKHPDAEKFIDAKLTQGKVTGANISVKIDDEFMKSLVEDKVYTQQYPIDSANPSFEKEVNPKDLWKKIVHNAWKSAEPGILFWDTIIKESIPDCYADLGYKTVSTNPCGEIPLCPYDSCRLLAINLYSYVDKPFTPDAKFNFNLFKKHVAYAQRFSDDIIDLEIEKNKSILNKIERDPEDEEIKMVEKKLWTNIEKKAEEGRRMGLGITAEGDMLAALGLKYGTDAATDFSVEVHKTLAIEAYRSSVNLAKERKPFEIYDAEREKDNPFIQRLKKEDPKLYEDMVKYGRRNISLLTIAPTGTTSIMSQTTSGLENVYLPVYERKTKINPNDKNAVVDEIDDEGIPWQKHKVFHHKFETWLEVNGYNIAEVKKIASESVRDKEKEMQLNEIVKKSPYYGATSQDVDWVAKVKMQGAIQKWVDHSISVTVNVPENVDEKLVGEVYMTAWKEGCKGVTIYRENSRAGVLTSGKKKDLEGKIFPEERPKSIDAEVLQFNNNDEKWIAFIGLINGKPYEIFTGKKDEDILAVPNAVKKGKIVKEENGDKHYDFHYTDKNGYKNTIGGISHQFEKSYWNYAIFISGMLSDETPIEKVIKRISRLKEDVEGINSWKSGTIRALSKYVPNGTSTGELCPDCLKNGNENKLIFQEGCMKCSCGFSKCG